jgi:hypothetical protein
MNEKMDFKIDKETIEMAIRLTQRAYNYIYFLLNEIDDCLQKIAFESAHNSEWYRKIGKFVKVASENVVLVKLTIELLAGKEDIEIPEEVENRIFGDQNVSE